MKKKCSKVDENLKHDVKPWVKDFTLEELGPTGLFNEYLEMSKFSPNLLNQSIFKYFVRFLLLLCAVVSKLYYQARVQSSNSHVYRKIF